MNRYFTEGTRIANKPMKQYTALLLIEQMQIKTMSYCFFTYQIRKIFENSECSKDIQTLPYLISLQRLMMLITSSFLKQP